MEYDVDSTHGYSGIHRYFEGMMKFLPSDKVKIKRGLADADRSVPRRYRRYRSRGVFLVPPE